MTTNDNLRGLLKEALKYVAERDVGPMETGYLRSRITSALAAPDSGEVVPDIAPGIEAAAKCLESKAEAYANEFGSYDNETGCTEFRSMEREEYFNDLHELAEEIRALNKAPAKAEPGADCKACRAVQENEQNPNTECDECGWAGLRNGKPLEASTDE